MKRRSFLKTILAVAVAPFAVRAKAVTSAPSQADLSRWDLNHNHTPPATGGTIPYQHGEFFYSMDLANGAGGNGVLFYRDGEGLIHA